MSVAGVAGLASAVGAAEDVRLEIRRAAEAVADARRALAQVGGTRWRGRAGDHFTASVAHEQGVLRMLDDRLEELAVSALRHAHEAEAQHAAVVGGG